MDKNVCTSICAGVCVCVRISPVSSLARSLAYISQGSSLSCHSAPLFVCFLLFLQPWVKPAPGVYCVPGSMGSLLETAPVRVSSLLVGSVRDRTGETKNGHGVCASVWRALTVSLPAGMLGGFAAYDCPLVYEF